jgi:hypothetical protein
MDRFSARPHERNLAANRAVPLRGAAGYGAPTMPDVIVVE